MSYRVGTPKGRLTKLEAKFVEQPGPEVRPHRRVKLPPQAGEGYGLAHSGARPAPVAEVGLTPTVGKTSEEADGRQNWGIGAASLLAGQFQIGTKFQRGGTGSIGTLQV